jgi:hypothetical protein
MMQVGDIVDQLWRAAGWAGINCCRDSRAPIGRIERPTQCRAGGIKGGHPLVAQVVAASPVRRDLNRFRANLFLLAD